jgi:hypothetical protein
MLQSEIDAQPKHRDTPVERLSAPFARRPAGTGGPMHDLDRGFDFVAMLPARPRSAATTDITIVQKLIGRKRRGMGMHRSSVRIREVWGDFVIARTGRILVATITKSQNHQITKSYPPILLS